MIIITNCRCLTLHGIFSFFFQYLIIEWMIEDKGIGQIERCEKNSTCPKSDLRIIANILIGKCQTNYEMSFRTTYIIPLDLVE